MKRTIKWRLAQRIELWWWKNYLRKKDNRKYLNWKKHYWTNLLEPVREVVPFHPGGTVLDAGCGPAGVYMVLEDQQVTALDPLLNKYISDLEHFAPSWYPHVSFISCPLEEFDCVALFDIICCMNAINHVSDLSRAWTVIEQCTGIDSYLILTVDVHKYPFFKYLLRMIPGDILHPHQYDLQEYKEMIDKHHFRLVDLKLVKSGLLFDHYIFTAQRKTTEI